MNTTAVELDLKLELMLGGRSTTDRQALVAFAVLNLGIIESLRTGTINPDEAVSRFYNAANCLYVRRKLKNSGCDEIMSRGVQLPDLFVVLSPSVARRQFAIELNTLGKLSLKLLRSAERKPTNGQSRSGPRQRAG
jgi:hypothetical protein